MAHWAAPFRRSACPFCSFALTRKAVVSAMGTAGSGNRGLANLRRILDAMGLLALDSDNVQSYSDRELFSIIRDGVRFTGMPGFAGTETDDQIWDVVDYLRSLR